MEAKRGRGHFEISLFKYSHFLLRSFLHCSDTSRQREICVSDCSRERKMSDQTSGNRKGDEKKKKGGGVERQRPLHSVKATVGVAKILQCTLFSFPNISSKIETTKSYILFKVLQTTFWRPTKHLFSHCGAKFLCKCEALAWYLYENTTFEFMVFFRDSPGPFELALKENQIRAWVWSGVNTCLIWPGGHMVCRPVMSVRICLSDRCLRVRMFYSVWTSQTRLRFQCSCSSERAWHHFQMVSLTHKHKDAVMSKCSIPSYLNLFYVCVCV